MNGELQRKPGEYALLHFETEKGRQETKKQRKTNMVSLDL
jgi:hypothetical protein